MKIKDIVKILSGIAILFIAIQIINQVTQGYLSSFGILPRDIQGLIGIPFAPMIHHSWQHLASNLIPFILLSFFVLQSGLKVYIFTYLFITFVAGISVWLLGAPAYHAGSSTLIFGFWGFLVGLAYFTKSVKNILIAICVLLLYGGIAFSLLNFAPHISWSSHFFGLLSGIFAAKLLDKKKNQ